MAATDDPASAILWARLLAIQMVSRDTCHNQSCRVNVGQGKTAK